MCNGDGGFTGEKWVVSPPIYLRTFGGDALCFERGEKSLVLPEKWEISQQLRALGVRRVVVSKLRHLSRMRKRMETT